MTVVHTALSYTHLTLCCIVISICPQQPLMYNYTASMGRKHIGVTQCVVRLSWPESRNMANGNEEMREWRNKKMCAALGKTTDHGLSHFPTHTASQHGWPAGSFLCGGYPIIHKLAISYLEASSAMSSWKRVHVNYNLFIFVYDSYTLVYMQCILDRK